MNIHGGTLKKKKQDSLAVADMYNRYVLNGKTASDSNELTLPGHALTAASGKDK